jgi:hypothetical protein
MLEIRLQERRNELKELKTRLLIEMGERKKAEKAICENIF